MSRIFCNSANEVIVPTQKVKDLLQSYGVKRPIHIQATGIELSSFQPEKYSAEQVAAAKAELGLSKEHFVFLNIGRISEEKNLSELIAYMAPVLAAEPNWRLVFVGRGPDLERFQQEAAATEAAGQISFAGERPWEKIGLYYQTGDVFVSSSVSETQGLTYIEAQAAGLPVIARRDPCLDEVILENVNGYMYEEQGEFAKACQSLATNPSLYQEFSTKSLELAHKFSAQSFANSVAKLYEELLANFTGNISFRDDFEWPSFTH